MVEQTAIYTIRRMTAADVQGVAEVERDVFTTAWTEESFAQELANELTTYLVICVAEEVVGFAGFWLVAQEAQVTNIAIKQDWQGRGYGRVLVEALIKVAQTAGALHVYLEVRPSNKYARRLYDKLGFKEIGIRPGYYLDNGEHALLMARSL